MTRFVTTPILAACAALAMTAAHAESRNDSTGGGQNNGLSQVTQPITGAVQSLGAQRQTDDANRNETGERNRLRDLPIMPRAGQDRGDREDSATLSEDDSGPLQGLEGTEGDDEQRQGSLSVDASLEASSSGGGSDESEDAQAGGGLKGDVGVSATPPQNGEDSEENTAQPVGVNVGFDSRGRAGSGENSDSDSGFEQAGNEFEEEAENFEEEAEETFD